MTVRRASLAAAILLAAFTGGALAKCVLPKPVRAYLKTHPSWSVVDDVDLGVADRLAWRKAHRGACPGFAAVNLRGAHETSYALAVTNQARGGRNERLILLEADGKRLASKTLVPAFPVGDPLVVWRGRGRAVREFGSKRKIAIAHDSIRFEKIGMSSKVFYLDGGAIRMALTTD